MELNYLKTVERWCYNEISLQGNSQGNPFTDYEIKGRFKSKNEDKTVTGFYDGNGTYKVRFMPGFSGDYSFRIYGSFSEREYEGDFNVTKASKNNHGPVRVAHDYHFAYEDGSAYYSIGTTAYAWTHQNEELQESTLRTLAESPFNKIRFCVFPKHYEYNFTEPPAYPYEGTIRKKPDINNDNFQEFNGHTPCFQWDFSRFNPDYFRYFENRIIDLMNLGIEADIIMLHPYDRWGFSVMTAEQDALYFKYIIARFSAFRNVWWSLANEYDLMKAKSLSDWERLAGIVCEYDPYNHLRSIHNCGPFYNHSRPWISHCSIQRQDVYRTAENVNQWRTQYKKPVVLDEICYEGNIQYGWGNISGRELVRRFWEATCRGGYAGHGETFLGHNDVLWWSHGGVLYGESPERFRFLARILEEIPGHGLKPYEKASWDEAGAIPEELFPSDSFYLFYYGFNRPSFRNYYFNDSGKYQVDVIDTWEMTIIDKGVFSQRFTIDMPGKEYMAVRIRKIG